MSLVALGAVSRPHGVRGQLRVHRYNPDSEALLGRETVSIRQGDRTEERKVLDARIHGKVLLLTLDGVTSREAAEALRGAEIMIPRGELPPLEEDEFYLFDLVGLTAVSPEGETVGSVVDVIQYPASDCLLVRGDGKRSWEVPVGEPYVREIDVEGGRVVVCHLEDLA